MLQKYVMVLWALESFASIYSFAGKIKRKVCVCVSTIVVMHPGFPQ